MILPNKDILKYIHNIDILTKKLLSGLLTGDFRTKKQGTGFEFHQLRDYQQGDDIRFIDWRSSAKSKKILVRQYIEDRNRSIIIATDFSNSCNYSSIDISKLDLIKQISAILLFATYYNKDHLHTIFFTDKIESIFQVKGSKNSLIAIVKNIFSYKPKSLKTDINKLLKYLLSIKSRNSLVFILSDFFGDIDKNLLSLASKKHDIIAIRFLDRREINFPEIGILDIKDSETETISSFNINNDYVFNSSLKLWYDNQNDILKLANIDYLDIIVGSDFKKDFIKFLKYRVIS